MCPAGAESTALQRSTTKSKMRLAKLTSAFIILFAVACHDKQVPIPPDHPRLTANVTSKDIIFHSTSLDHAITYRVIMPAKTSPGQKLAVVYLLHGGGGSYRDWSNYS